MAITTQVDKVAIKMNLNNGRDSEGRVKTVAVNLGSINAAVYGQNLAISRQHVMALTDALTPCLSKGIYSVQEQVTNTLIDE